ncbi:MAG: CRISPR-associated helicase Cas3' [Bacteroidota bacterium]
MYGENTLAKPSGITLKDHSLNVKAQVVDILSTWPFLANKYRQLTGLELSDFCVQAAEYHDLGKRHHAWQTACRKDYKTYQSWLKKRGLADDPSDFKARATYESECKSKGRFAAENLVQAGIRHELASLRFLEKNGLATSVEVQVAIAAHHAKLHERFKHRWEKDGAASNQLVGPFIKYWKTFEALQGSAFGLKKLDDCILRRFRFDAVRSILRLADTRASKAEGEGKEALVSLKTFNQPKGFAGNQLRPVQRAAVEAAEQWQTILRAPTGSGKTYASLLWAERQILRESPRADRLIIAMPTRFTSNALAISAADQMGETGLYHSSAWLNRYGAKEKEQQRQKSLAQEQHKLSKLLAYPITVCTIDHLLMCLAATTEDHHATFYFLANSCVVFDEVDFYDPFIQANLEQLLHVLLLLKVPVLIMSATVPNSALQQYGFPGKIISAQGTKDKLVHKKLILMGPAETADDVTSVLQEMITRGQGIIYANTVKRALNYYYYLSQQLKAIEADIPLIIYHSRFTEPDKKRIEARIIDCLGKKISPAAQTEVNGIVILTQIGEMSINISSSIMLTDLCPWDRFAQRVGRLGRFAEVSEAVVYVVIPTAKGKLYPAPYGSYDRSTYSWKASRAFTNTIQQIEAFPRTGQVFDADSLVDWVNELYPIVENYDEKTRLNLENYRKHIRKKWLIVPDSATNEEETEINDQDEWRSRDIDSQGTVLVRHQEHFKSWQDYYSFQLEYGVSCRAYELIPKKGQEDQHPFVKRVIKVGDEDRSNVKEQIAYFVDDGYYNPTTGLIGLYGKADLHNFAC